MIEVKIMIDKGHGSAQATDASVQ